MKTFVLSSILIFYVLAPIYGQKNEVEFSVIKEYDKNGNLIRYDSTRVGHEKHSKNSFHYSFSSEHGDSLLKGLDHLGEKMGVFISDSLKARLDNLFDKENFQIWMDDFDEEDFPKHYFFDWNEDDSPAHKNKFKFHFQRFGNDSLLKVHLEKQLEKVDKRIKKKHKKSEVNE